MTAPADPNRPGFNSLRDVGHRCPDTVACTHDCQHYCWRVLACGPLSIAGFPDNQWPEPIRVAHTFTAALTD